MGEAVHEEKWFHDSSSCWAILDGFDDWAGGFVLRGNNQPTQHRRQQWEWGLGLGLFRIFRDSNTGCKIIGNIILFMMVTR